MTESDFAPTRRPARPSSLGGLLGLVLALVVTMAPATVAAERPDGRRAARSPASRPIATQPVANHPDAAPGGAPTGRALAFRGPGSVTLGLGRLFTTQFDGSPYANGNCNMAAGAMLFEVQTGRFATGAQMRRWSRARTSGTNLVDLRRAFQAQGQWVQIAEDMSWDRFVGEVRSGRSAVVQGWYGNLRQNVLQAGFTTGHSVFVLGYSSHARRGQGAFYVMDPLGSGGYDGAWWSRAELKRFGWGGRPGHVGTGRDAYFGNVALQASPSRKRMSSRAYRPAFQSYWDTSKHLMERARRVTLVERSRGRSPFVLRVRDPRLRMTPASARRWGMNPPVRGWGRQVLSLRVDNRRLVIRTRGDAKVVAAARGRVIFRGWTLSGTRYVWIQHGTRLFTIYRNLDVVRVEPGQWVTKGQTIGRAAVETRKTRRGKVRVGHITFVVAVGDPRRVSSRERPLPYLDGGYRRQS